MSIHVIFIGPSFVYDSLPSLDPSHRNSTLLWPRLWKPKTIHDLALCKKTFYSLSSKSVSFVSYCYTIQALFHFGVQACNSMILIFGMKWVKSHLSSCYPYCQIASSSFYLKWIQSSMLQSTIRSSFRFWAGRAKLGYFLSSKAALKFISENVTPLALYISFDDVFILFVLFFLKFKFDTCVKSCAYLWSTVSVGAR